MSIGPREVALFVVDCSLSMATPRSITEDAGEYQRTSIFPPFDVALQYVKAKIAQRIMRDLKTTPCGVITYGVEKTKNILTGKLKLEGNYSKADDPYRHYFIEIAITSNVDVGMLEHLEQIKAGEGPDAKGKLWSADAHTALILAISTLEADSKSSNFKKKEIYLLTDGESKSDWDGWEDTAKKLNQMKISLCVIGFNFDDDDIDFVEEGKSKIKRDNEKHLNAIVNMLVVESVVATSSRALSAIAQPRIREVASQATRTTLTLGDTVLFPDQSLTIHIDIKKAVSSAGVKSMKQMSLRGFEKSSAIQASQSQANDPPPPTSASFGGFSNMGRTFDMTLADAGLTVGNTVLDQAAEHGVTRETLFFYRPSALTAAEAEKKKKNDEEREKAAGEEVSDAREEGEEGGDDEEEEPEEEEDESLKPVNAERLTQAHYYGGTLVDTGDMEEGTGQLPGKQTGMQIIGFQRMDQIRYEWRLNDPLYVYGAPGLTGSQLILSAFANALHERRSVAIVRYTAKGMNSKGVFRIPDPKIGFLYPFVDNPLEYFYFVQMPFQEDVRQISFPSLTNIFNRKNEPLKEHQFIPTPVQNAAMDDLVDNMSLIVPDEDGNPSSWFSVEESYSPAIHNVENTLVFRLSNVKGDLPPPPLLLTQFLNPPKQVVARSAASRKRAIEVFDIKPVPPRPKKISKQVNNFTQETRIIDADRLFNSTGTQAATPSALTSAAPNRSTQQNSETQSDLKPTFVTQKPPTTQKTKESSQKFAMDVDEDEDDAEVGPEAVAMKVDAPSGDESGPEPDTEDDDEDDVPPPSSIARPVVTTVGRQDPLADFQSVVRSKGVSVAVKQMFEVVEYLVESSFSTAKYKIAADSLRAARIASQAEPQLYNSFLRSWLIKLSKNKRKKDFIPVVQQEKLGLITGGSSGTTQDDADQFLQSLTL